MSDDNVTQLFSPAPDALNDVLLSGARTLLAAAIEAEVSDHDDNFQLSHLTFTGGKFTIPGTSLDLGKKVRLRILARDVSLTLAHQTDTSILNIFPAIVEEIMEENASQMTVRVSAQGVPILSRITRKSATALGLEVGKHVYVQVKSVATLA